MRERLTELLKKAPLCNRDFDLQYSDGTIEKITDYLLENGVIVPLCKVGDFVYVIYGRKIQLTKVFSMKIESEDDHYIFYFKCMVHQGGSRFEKFVYGKTVFLTKEEAEQVLKGGEG